MPATRPAGVRGGGEREKRQASRRAGRQACRQTWRRGVRDGCRGRVSMATRRTDRHTTYGTARCRTAVGLRPHAAGTPSSGTAKAIAIYSPDECAARHNNPCPCPCRQGQPGRKAAGARPAPAPAPASHAKADGRGKPTHAAGRLSALACWRCCATRLQLYFRTLPCYDSATTRLLFTTLHYSTRLGYDWLYAAATLDDTPLPPTTGARARALEKDTTPTHAGWLAGESVIGAALRDKGPHDLAACMRVRACVPARRPSCLFYSFIVEDPPRTKGAGAGARASLPSMPCSPCRAGATKRPPEQGRDGTIGKGCARRGGEAGQRTGGRAAQGRRPAANGVQSSTRSHCALERAHA